MFFGSELIATTTEENKFFPLEYLSHIINDGTDTIYVGVVPFTGKMQGQTTTAGLHLSNYFTIKPGESVGGFPCTIKKLYFKSASGNQPFRVGGLTVYGGR